MGDLVTESYPNTTTTSGPHLTCDRTYEENNRTVFVYGGYEGIPENLAINCILWLLLILAFSFLRRIAWNYGRLALVTRAETRRSRAQPITQGTESRYNVWTTMFYGDDPETLGSQPSLDSASSHTDKGFFSWIPAYFKVKDEDILQKTGPDGVQYLKFQRYLIVYMCIITVLSIGVILPVNFQGDLEGDKSSFAHTTIANINVTKNNNLLWVHSVFAVVYLVMAIVFMRHFSVNLNFEEDEQATRSLIVSNIPKEYSFKNFILQHFSEAYPGKTIQDVQFAYDIKKLSNLDQKRQFAADARMNSEQIFQQTGEKPEMVPRVCGQCCCRCCNCDKVDCIDYYKSLEDEYREKCETEKVEAFKSNLGIAFVTFESDSEAESVYLNFKISCRSGLTPRTSSISRTMAVYNWEVKYAPPADDLYWENLSLSPALWWAKAIIFNLLLLLLLFFLTTPSVVLNLLNSWGTLKQLHSPILVQFTPVLLLFAASALLPSLVYLVDFYCIGHWTRSSEHHAIMRKTFVYLILMILILPSLGLTSANALLTWLRRSEDHAFRWECVFVPNNGAFFVNYVITAAFIGTAVELIRLPDLLIYSIKLAIARSAAERKIIKKRSVWEYQYGAQYAWMLCVFSVIMSFSILCPMITPFGLIYLVLKHLVQRYNLYFAYHGSTISKKIHASAINFVIVAVVIQQMFLLAFTYLRSGEDPGNPITIFQSVAMAVTLSVLCGRVCCGVFKGLSPVAYKPSKTEDTTPVHEADGSDKPFVATVLTEKDAPTIVLEDGAGAGVPEKKYGATDSTGDGEQRRLTEEE